MKYKIKGITMAVLVSSGIGSSITTSEAALITYSFTGSSGNEASLAPDSQTAHLTASNITRGSGLNTASGAGTFAASGWTLGNSPDANDYFSFTLTPESGYVLSLTQLILDERRSLTGIREWSVRSSLDGFSSDLATFAVPDNDATRTGQTISLSAALFGQLDTPIEFRIYGYSSEQSGGTWRIDNLMVDGSVTASTTAATVPDSLPFAFTGGILATTLFGGGCLRKRLAS
jgi:hypothetical protein